MFEPQSTRPNILPGYLGQLKEPAQAQTSASLYCSIKQFKPPQYCSPTKLAPQTIAVGHYFIHGSSQPCSVSMDIPGITDHGHYWPRVAWLLLSTGQYCGGVLLCSNVF